MLKSRYIRPTAWPLPRRTRRRSMWPRVSGGSSYDVLPKQLKEHRYGNEVGQEIPRMFRKDLITLLLDNPLRLSEIARLYAVPLKEGLDDVKHLRKTLKQSAYRLATPSGKLP